MGSFYYATCHTVLRGILPLLTSIEVQGIEHIPRSGPCLLVGNHLSNFDPFCLIAYVPRHFHGIAKVELFHNWLAKGVLSGLEPILVRRSGVDRQALRQAEHYLKQGAMVLVYAEGTRSKTGVMQEARAGAVFLAQRTGAPIVPIAVSGTDKVFSKQFPWYHRLPVRLTIGQPFSLADLGQVTHYTRHELAQAVMQRVGALLPPASTEALP